MDYEEEHIEDHSDENDGGRIKLDVGFKFLFRHGRNVLNRSFNESEFS